MAITGETLNADQATRLLSLDEGHFLDFKSRDSSPGTVTKTLSALANADGGDIYIGVDDDKAFGRKHWRGFSNQEAANGLVQAIEEFFPIGESTTCEFLSCPGWPGLVLHATIHKNKDIKGASDGKTYIRRGAQNLPVRTPDELERLRLNKGITSYESQTVAVDVDVVSNSETIIAFMLTVVPTGEPLPWLRKQQLVHHENPTVAGVLLFAEEPQAVLPKHSAVKIYRYKTSRAEGYRDALSDDPTTIEGCAYEQIQQSVNRTIEIIATIPALGAEGLMSVVYPQEALHEIVTNAVLHRDYSLADDVHIRIFDNRIEVESPGRLPAHITTDNILQERFARNGNLVRIINKFPNPPNKDIGEGLNTAFEAMHRLRLKPPIIEQRENSVLVTIRHERLASPEDIIMEYLTQYPVITNRVARSLCAISSENAMKSVFYRLRDRGMIERVPKLVGPKAAWQLRSGATRDGQ